MNPTADMNRYRLFRRKNGIYFCQDNRTNKQESLKTRDKEQAERVVFHKNESERTIGANRQIAIAYLLISDPGIKTRTWSDVMRFYCEQPGKEATKKRKSTAMKDDALQALKSVVIIDTTPEQFLSVLRKGTVSTNCYLRKLHNLARKMKWLPEEILVRGMWPVIKYGAKRAITLEEHRRILSVTHTVERQKFYEVLWGTGAGQSDIANLTADRIDWERGTIKFHRVKLDGREAGSVNIVMGPTLEDVIASLPHEGRLFPNLAAVGENDRSTVFSRQCEKLGIEGVTLHSYRYAAIQRAKACGYNKRHAMAMAGHTKEQTHDDYAAGATLTIPSLEECELAYQMAQQQRIKLREERRKKIINMKEHLAKGLSLPQEESSAA